MKEVENRGPSMAHVGFHGARHMHPERVPSAKKERTLALRLFDTADVSVSWFFFRFILRM